MNKAAGLIDSGAEPALKERDLWKKSFSNFESGIRTFDVLDDRLVILKQGISGSIMITTNKRRNS